MLIYSCKCILYCSDDNYAAKNIALSKGIS